MSHSSQASRPECVPSLDLGSLADRDNSLKQPVEGYEPKLSPPDTASTVSQPEDHRASLLTRHERQHSQKASLTIDKSWGYHDYSPAASRRDTKRPPFALHHSPEVSSRPTGRDPRPSSVPRLNLHDDCSAPDASAGSQRGPLQPPYHTHDDQPTRVQLSPRPHSGVGEGQRSSARLDLEKKIDALKIAEARKRELIMQTVLTDQLSRAAISDPQQNDADVPASNRSLFGEKPQIRNLHYTKVRTTQTGTEQLLSKCVNFNARILTRDGQFALRLLYGFYFAIDNTITVYEYRQFGKQSSALPFVTRGSYSHVVGRRKGRKFTIRDISVGSDLSFDTTQQGTLPTALAKQSVLKLRIVEVDTAAKERVLFNGNVPFNNEVYAREMHPALTQQEHEDTKLITQMQGFIQQKIRRRASKTLTGLALHFHKLDRSGAGKFTKEDIKQALTTFHIDVDPKLFSSVWLILDQHSDGRLTYSEFRRYFFGEMNEFRNSLVRKAFQRVDANKSGMISLNETRKFFCPHFHPLVVSGKMTAEDVREGFYDLFNNRKREISYGIFEDYHEGASINAGTDDEFEAIMKGCWNL